MGDSTSKGMNRWCSDPTNTKFKALPLFTAWGIWFARNDYIFKNRVILLCVQHGACPYSVDLNRLSWSSS
jgi:hypothetical protein